MKKGLKKFLIAASILIVLFVLFLIAWVFLIFPKWIAPSDTASTENPEYTQISESSEKIDFDNESGMLYVNNEVVIFIRSGTSQEAITALFNNYDAEVDNVMADIDVYRLIFSESKTYEELVKIVNNINKDPIVEKAYINTVSSFQEDTVESEDDFPYRDPVYPNDTWMDDSWDVNVPRGENWGVEAINAPGAWAYLDQMQTVKIGLIDECPDSEHPDLEAAKSFSIFIDEKTGKIYQNKYLLAGGDHGTHVAGTMNAVWNNETGVSGITGNKGELYYSAVYYDFNGDISSKYGTAFSYLLSLKTLIDQDVQVINISQNTSRLIGFAASHGNDKAVQYLSQQAELTEKGLLKIIQKRESANKSDFVICLSAGNSNDTYYYKDESATYGYREQMTIFERIKFLFGWRGEIGNSLAEYNNFLGLMDDKDVKDRVIIVGAIEIDEKASTAASTKYAYASFSNVGSRVDIVAPGCSILSCIAGGKYEELSGTSMAAPHVSGVAALVFACNPDLSGPDVKNIIKTCSTGRYYYGSDYSGLLNAESSVVSALKTLNKSVNQVLNANTSSGLDLSFVVDSTASMGDDIDNAKANMENILSTLSSKTENYRVALIDYRDFPERTDDSGDYPSRIQLSFSNNNEKISNAINALSLGYGGDSNETVFSALMSAVRLEWRPDAKKVIIILGDAPPLDPEPNTNYTYDDVLRAIYNADINIDLENSDDRVTGEMDSSMISVYSIGTNASSDAAEFFAQISESTGGSYVGVDDASQVSDAIVDSIEKIKIDPKVTAVADFGDELANESIQLYSPEDEYLFTIHTNENGQAVIKDIEPADYSWSCNSVYGGGKLLIEEGSRNASVSTADSYWFAPLLIVWQQHVALILILFLLYIVICLLVPKFVRKICRRHRKPEIDADYNTVENFVAEEQATSAELEAPVTDNRVSSCPNCGGVPEAGAAFCNHCGYPLNRTKQQKYCTKCGSPITGSETFCTNCGAKL